MTTIATDGKSMAGDGQETHSNGTITALNMQKVRRLPDGSIIGICGDVVDALQFVKWLSDGGVKPKFARPFEALVISKRDDNALFYYYTPNLFPIPTEAPVAIGHGMQFALAAMDCGRSPMEAVKVAIGRDAWTGGQVTVLRIDDDTAPAS